MSGAVKEYGHVIFFESEGIMSRVNRLLVGSVVLFALGGCANMSTRDRNTAVGAAAGAVAGSILTGGDAIGTVGGAAVGGVIGNQVKH